MEWSWNHEAVEQADEADEAPLDRERGMMGGCGRGDVVIVSVPACSGASQLIRSVRRLFESSRDYGMARRRVNLMVQHAQG
jgi:hypothetical protein